MMLFGGLYAIAMGLWVLFVIWIIVSIISFSAFGGGGLLVMVIFNLFAAFSANSMVRHSFLKKGWTEIADQWIEIADQTQSDNVAQTMDWTGPERVIIPTEKKCPFCAETVKFEAIKCKHCGSDFPVTQAAV